MRFRANPLFKFRLFYTGGVVRYLSPILRKLLQKRRLRINICSWISRDPIGAAARRQKWIDQAQSLNLFLAEPDLKTLSHMYRRGLGGLDSRTTYYLRSLGASNIEKSSVTVEKEKRSVVGNTAAPTPEAIQACSIEAMMNGEECEACQ